MQSGKRTESEALRKPPLVVALKSLLSGDKVETWLNMIEWMIDSGANPLQQTGPKEEELELQVEEEYHGMFRPQPLTIRCAGESASTVACHAVEAMKKQRYVANWSARIRHFQSAVAILSKGKPTHAKRNLSVPAGVVDMWESIREMTHTHNVIFETADEEVSAHDLILVAASPVLKAMPQSTMKEGSSKRIPVKDSSGSGVRLLLDMLYTNFMRDDPDCKAVLVALDLAHRWQVDRIVPVLAGILMEMITVESFVAIAEASILRGLELLQRACRTVATNSSELETGAFPREVRKLLGEPEAPAAAACRDFKKRRTFAAR